MSKPKTIDQVVVDGLFDAIPPIEGEMRVVKQCDKCGHMWCHQFIPFASGRGRGTTKCMCVAVSINGEHQAKTIEERTP